MAQRSIPNTARRFGLIGGNYYYFVSEWRVDGVLTTPTTYELKLIRASTETVELPAVTVRSTGILQSYWKLSDGPDWGERYYLKWTGTGAAEGVKEFVVYAYKGSYFQTGIVYPSYD